MGHAAHTDTDVVVRAYCLAAGEAPMLKALVEAGKLPPVEERLPENPMVIEPVSRSVPTVVHGVMPILEWVIPPLLIKWGTLVW